METYSRLDSALLLSSINVPGGERVSVVHAGKWQSPVVFCLHGSSGALHAVHKGSVGFWKWVCNAPGSLTLSVIWT